MDQTTVKKLLQLNAEFYQTFANQFSATRQRLQPGVRRVIESMPKDAKLLDLGCGNGELARTLAQSGFRGRYMGVDFSEGLLEVAREGQLDGAEYIFIPANLADPAWAGEISKQQSNFDFILAFAALHHLPGKSTHLGILKTVRSLLSPQGRFIHSNWQFLNSERLRKRVHAWSEIGLNDTALDPGDYLLDWRRGGFGLRYVHHFSEDELENLATETGFRIIETFYSDGESGNLGLYQVWVPEN